MKKSVKIILIVVAALFVLGACHYDINLSWFLPP